MNNNNNKYGFLEDANGNKSSKRLIGCIEIVLAMIITVTVVTIAIFRPVEDDSLIIDILAFLFSSGTALLGIGTFERNK